MNFHSGRLFSAALADLTADFQLNNFISNLFIKFAQSTQMSEPVFDKAFLSAIFAVNVVVGTELVVKVLLYIVYLKVLVSLRFPAVEGTFELNFGTFSDEVSNIVIIFEILVRVFIAAILAGFEN